MEPVGLLCSLKTASEPYTELTECRPHTTDLFISSGFNIILPSVPGMGEGADKDVPARMNKGVRTVGWKVLKENAT
jgi:hypothetical protein